MKIIGIDLGTANTSISLPFITVDEGGQRKDLELTLTRKRFEQLTKDLLDRINVPLRIAMADARLTPEQIDKVILVGGPTRMPQVQNLLKDIFGKDPHKDINPEECVALGAAIQGGVLEGSVKDVLLLDVLPLSLGIETMGNVFTKLIEKNETVPTRRSQIFSTASDGQHSVEIKVLQGEKPMTQDNSLLGTFILFGIPPAPKGVPQIEVTFDIDANGILEVIAEDLGTKKKQSVRVTATTTLSKMEIQHLRKEMQAYAADDKRREELVNIKNQADDLIFNTKKFLDELNERITLDEKKEVEDALTFLEEILKRDSDTLVVDEVHEKKHIIGLSRGKEVKRKDKIQCVKDAMDSVNELIYSISQRIRQEAPQQHNNGNF